MPRSPCISYGHYPRQLGTQRQTSGLVQGRCQKCRSVRETDKVEKEFIHDSRMDTFEFSLVVKKIPLLSQLPLRAYIGIANVMKGSAVYSHQLGSIKSPDSTIQISNCPTRWLVVMIIISKLP